MIGLAVVGGATITVRHARSSMETSKSYTLYSGAAQWLNQNTESGTRVFQTDWDDFPRLFFYDTHNTYLIGLDPTYMQLYDANLYNLWVKITRGELETPSDFIYTRFGADYIVSDLLHTDFIHKAENDPGLREVYRDSEAVIFQVEDGNQLQRES